MKKQRTCNRNFAYGTYDAPTEDIISLIPAEAGELEDFTDSAALSILQNRRDVAT